MNIIALTLDKARCKENGASLLQHCKHEAIWMCRRAAEAPDVAHGHRDEYLHHAARHAAPEEALPLRAQQAVSAP